MAPIDRNEHRQQRMRGAGVANVQTNFSFNLGRLSRPAKQASLPPQRSSRRTPVESTPRSSNGSARRHRSASIQRSSTKQRSKTPVNDFVTPQARLGKRKRGSTHATTAQTDDQIDELSPENAPSIEKSRKAVAPISPIREEGDGLPDELSFIGDPMSSVQKAGNALGLAQETPVPKIPKTRLPSADINIVTPRPNPAPPESDDELRTARSNTVPVRAKTKSPGRSQRDDDEVDELSPVQVKDTAPEATQGGAPEPMHPERHHQSNNAADEEELSGTKARGGPRHNLEEVAAVSQPTPTATQKTPAANKASTARTSRPGRAQRVIQDDEEDNDDEDIVHTTPAVTKRRRLKSKSLDVRNDAEEVVVDELSPEGERPRGKHPKSRLEREPAPVILSDQESSDGYQESQDEAEDRELPSRPTAIRRPRSPIQKKPQPKPSGDKPPKKRRKLGPTQLIQVMRLKGFGVKSLTVVDTTRTVMEEWTAHRINRITEKLANVNDSARAKGIRQHRNVILAYRERLDDVLLDLQDANDTGIANVNKLRQLNKDNRRLRAEYIALQHERDQIALQNDEVTDAFLREKKEIEARNELSSSLYDIEAAIRSGKDRARKEGRENEGPELPIKMLLDNVARNTGPVSGLLAKVKNFNGVLDRAAGFLEGRS